MRPISPSDPQLVRGLNLLIEVGEPTEPASREDSEAINYAKNALQEALSSIDDSAGEAPRLDAWVGTGLSFETATLLDVLDRPKGCSVEHLTQLYPCSRIKDVDLKILELLAADLVCVLPPNRGKATFRTTEAGIRTLESLPYSRLWWGAEDPAWAIAQQAEDLAHCADQLTRLAISVRTSTPGLADEAVFVQVRSSALAARTAAFLLHSAGRLCGAAKTIPSAVLAGAAPSQPTATRP